MAPCLQGTPIPVLVAGRTCALALGWAWRPAVVAGVVRRMAWRGGVGPKVPAAPGPRAPATAASSQPSTPAPGSPLFPQPVVVLIVVIRDTSSSPLLDSMQSSAPPSVRPSPSMYGHGDTLHGQKGSHIWPWGHFALAKRPPYMGMGTLCAGKNAPIHGHGDTLHWQKGPR